MSCREHNASDARRLLLGEQEDPPVEGVDFVDVVDAAALNDDLRWQFLAVHMLPGIDMDAVRIAIERTRGAAALEVQWSKPAVDLAPAVVPDPLDPDFVPDPAVWFYPGTGGGSRLLTVEELSFLSGWTGADRILIVHITHEIPPQDNSAVYRLCVTSASNDPRLSTYDFTLHAEGPTDLDCGVAPFSAPAAAYSPPLDYLARDFSSLRRLMLDRLAVTIPDWRKRNTADIGVALVEILAYAGDQLSYYQDAVATEAYLTTSRRRISVRRHARILDYRLHEGNNARVWISVEFATDGCPEEPDFGADGIMLPFGTAPLEVIPAGTVLMTQLKNQTRPILGADEQEEGVVQGAVFFQTMTPFTPIEELSRLPLHDWAGAVECLPTGTTSAVLAVHGKAYATLLGPGKIVIFEEIDDAVGGVQADSSHRHAVCLTATKEIHNAIDDKLYLLIEWHPDDALPFSLPLRYASGAPAAAVYGNVVLADHGRTITDQPLIPSVVPGQERYRPYLAQSGVTHRNSDTVDSLSKLSASAQLLQDPRKAVPVVTVAEALDGTSSDGRTWHPRQDLLSSGAFDRHFAVEVEADGRAYLRFGDSMYGRAPSRSSEWSATYRIGNGGAGNIGADAIAHMIITPYPECDPEEFDDVCPIRVRNPLPAAGGNEPERTEQARLYAPYEFRVGERAVTSHDYAELIERHQAVQKALASIQWTGTWDTVFITVDPAGGRILDDELEGELRSFVEPFRMAGQDLEFQAPEFVPLDIAFTVHVARDYLQSEVRAELLQKLGPGRLASGSVGFFHPDNFSFGEPVYLSHLLARAMKVPGVAWIDIAADAGVLHRFQRLGEPDRGELENGAIIIGPRQIIRLDNDPVAPYNGRLQLHMEGGL